MAPAQAQAQAQAQQTISHTESLELVRCLLRVSIFHISYLRGLFPDGHYKGVDMKNLDGMNIKMLLPACEESRRLIDWVEEGVYDAIRRSYLKTLFFGISTDPEGTNLLEEYVFNFSYGNGAVSMDLQQRAGAAGAKGAAAKAGDGCKSDITTVKYQVMRMMRMLVQLCQTLDRVPTQRFVFMKLMYHDHTPEDYDPPYFAPVEGEDTGVGHFSRKPFSMKVGDVTTRHHGVTMKIKSTLDCCGEDGGGEEGTPEPEVASVQQATSGGTQEGAGAQGPGGKGYTSKRQPQASPPSTDLDMTEQEAPSDGGAWGGAGAGAPDQALEQHYTSVKRYVLQCFQTYSQVELVDALGHFMGADPGHITAAFDRLQREGVVVADAARLDTFRPAAAAGAKGAPTAAATPMDLAVRQMAGMAVGDAGGAQGRAQAVRASQKGGIDAAGSDATGTGSALPAPRRSRGQANGGAYLDTDMQSGANQATGRKRKQRKASYVEQPIYQAGTPKSDNGASTAGGRAGRGAAKAAPAAAGGAAARAVRARR